MKRAQHVRGNSLLKRGMLSRFRAGRPATVEAAGRTTSQPPRQRLPPILQAPKSKVIGSRIGAVQVTLTLTPEQIKQLFGACAREMANSLARIEAKLDAAAKQEQRIMSVVSDLTAAVQDNLAAQKEGFSAIAAEDLNIELAITKLGASNDPAVQTQIDALKAATKAQRANTATLSAENDKLALALGTVAVP